jgi:hypothetical protein
MLTRPDAFVGFSTSPKGDFNIVKLWTNTMMPGSAKT